jgi:hypothetical protein
MIQFENAVFFSNSGAGDSFQVLVLKPEAFAPQKPPDSLIADIRQQATGSAVVAQLCHVPGNKG